MREIRARIRSDLGALQHRQDGAHAARIAAGGAGVRGRARVAQYYTVVDGRPGVFGLGALLALLLLRARTTLRQSAARSVRNPPDSRQ